MYTCTKTYGHDVGLSCVFRQHRAESHCAQLHGYALSFSFTFGCTHLDERNWVVDFGSLKNLKAWLQDMFDHKLAVARDDPNFQELLRLDRSNLAEIRVFGKVGCEAFAQLAWETANRMVYHATNGRARCISCTVSEHGANSATCVEDRPWEP